MAGALLLCDSPWVPPRKEMGLESDSQQLLGLPERDDASLFHLHKGVGAGSNRTFAPIRGAPLM